MISRKWKKHKEPVFVVDNSILEDFVVIKEKDYYVGYYTKGIEFQKQDLYKSYSKSPLGPFENEELVERGEHVRLCKAKLNDKEAILSSISPGLPKTGLWLYKWHNFGITRTLLLNPKPKTFYSVSACNPTVIHDGKEYNIYFEGRNEEVKWRVFQALWSGNKHHKIDVIDIPLIIGANPFITKFGNKYYLYYSKYVSKMKSLTLGKWGFGTYVMTQEIE